MKNWKIEKKKRFKLIEIFYILFQIYLFILEAENE